MGKVKRSVVFVSEVDINISHVEARRLIRDYGLPHSEDEDSRNHETGNWSREPDGRYFIHLRT